MKTCFLFYVCIDNKNRFNNGHYFFSVFITPTVLFIKVVNNNRIKYSILQSNKSHVVQTFVQKRVTVIILLFTGNWRWPTDFVLDLKIRHY